MIDRVMLCAVFALGLGGCDLVEGDKNQQQAQQQSSGFKPLPRRFENCESDDSERLTFYDQFPHLLVQPESAGRVTFRRDDWKKRLGVDMTPEQHALFDELDRYYQASRPYFYGSEKGSTEQNAGFQDEAVQREFFQIFYDRYDEHRNAIEELSKKALDPDRDESGYSRTGATRYFLIEGMAENMLLTAALNLTLITNNRDYLIRAINRISPVSGNYYESFDRIYRKDFELYGSYNWKYNKYWQLYEARRSNRYLWNVLNINVLLAEDIDEAIDKYKTKKFSLSNFRDRPEDNDYSRVMANFNDEETRHLMSEGVCTLLYGDVVWDYLVYSKLEEPPIDDQDYIQSKKIYERTVSWNGGK